MAADPYKASMRNTTRALSMTPRSFENLFTKRPEGVSSKKLAGLRTIAFIMF